MFDPTLIQSPLKQLPLKPTPVLPVQNRVTPLRAPNTTVTGQVPQVSGLQPNIQQKLRATPPSGEVFKKQNKYMTKLEFSDMQKKSGIDKGILLKELLKKGYQMEGMETFESNKPMEFVSNVVSSAVSLPERTIGGIGMLAKSFGKYIAPDMAQTNTAENIVNAGEARKDATKKWFGERGVKQGTVAGDIGSIGTDLAPILMGSPSGLGASSIKTAPSILATVKNPEFWKTLGKYVASRGTIGAGEEIAYNVQQEGKILSDKRPYDLSIGTTLEVFMPIAFRALSSLAPVGKEVVINNIIDSYNKGEKTLIQATTELIEETSPRVDNVLKSSGIGQDTMNRVAGKSEELQKYIDYSHLRNTTDTAPTPRQMAVEKAKEARDIIVSKMNDTGSDIGGMRNKVSTTRIGQKAFDNVIDILRNETSSLNLVISNGKIMRKRGSISGLVSDSEISVLQSMLDDVYRAKQSPTMDNLIQLRDAISKRINFAKKASQTAGAIDGIATKMRYSLRDSNIFLGGNQQAKLLEEYSFLKQFLKEVSSYMDTKSGFGTLMKRVLSDKGGDGVKMFNTIKKYTGIDLMDDATFAKLATQLVGNKEQVSLLQQEMGMVAEGLKFVGGGWATRTRELAKNIFGLGVNNDDLERILLKAAKQQKPGITIDESLKLLGDTHYWDTATNSLKIKNDVSQMGNRYSKDIQDTIGKDSGEILGDEISSVETKSNNRGLSDESKLGETNKASNTVEETTTPSIKQGNGLKPLQEQAVLDSRKAGGSAEEIKFTAKQQESHDTLIDIAKGAETKEDFIRRYDQVPQHKQIFQKLGVDADGFYDMFQPTKQEIYNRGRISDIFAGGRDLELGSASSDYIRKAKALAAKGDIDGAIRNLDMAYGEGDSFEREWISDVKKRLKQSSLENPKVSGNGLPIKQVGTSKVIDMPVNIPQKTAGNGEQIGQKTGLPKKGDISATTSKKKPDIVTQPKKGIVQKGLDKGKGGAKETTKEVKQEYSVPKEFEETAKVIKEKFNTDVIIDKKKFNEGLKGESNTSHNKNVLGYVKDGKIYINPDKISKDVLVEEGTHLWYALAKNNNPEIVKMWKNLVSEVRKNKELGALYDKLAKVYDTDVLDEEFLAHIIGGNYIPLLARSDATLFGKINKFINRIKKWVIDKMIGNKSMIKFSPIELGMLDTKSFLEIISRDVTDPNIRPVDIEIWKSPAARILTAFDYDEYISDTRFSLGLEEGTTKSSPVDESFTKLQRAVKKGFGQEYNGDLGIVQMAGEHKFRGEEKPFLQQVTGGDIVNKLTQSIKLKIGDFYNLIDDSASLKIGYNDYHNYKDLSPHKLLIQEMREQDLERLAGQYKEMEDYVISDNYKRAAQELRDGGVSNGTAPAYQEIINTIAIKQAKSLDGWASALTKGDDSKKLLSAMLVDDVVRHEIDKSGRKQPRKAFSARPFVEHYSDAVESYIGDIYDRASKGVSFEKPNVLGYMEYAKRQISSSLGDRAITDFIDSTAPIEGVSTIKGRWIRFKDPSEAADLSKLSAGSSWCIQEKNTSKNYLQNYYFDIFVLDDGFDTPTIALRINKENDSIGEMRGNLKGDFDVENIPLSLTQDRYKGAKYKKNQHEEFNIKYKKAIEAHPIYSQDTFSKERGNIENTERLKEKQEALNQKYGTPTVDNYESFWEEAMKKGYLDDSLQFGKEDVNLVNGTSLYNRSPNVDIANDNFRIGYRASPYYYDIAQYRNKNLDFLIREEIKDMKEIGTLEDMSNNQNISILTEEGFTSENFIDRYGRQNGQFIYNGSVDFSKIKTIDGSLTITKKPKKGEFANLGKVYGMNSKFVMSHDGEYLKNVKVLTSEQLKPSISPKASINFPKTDTDLPISVISYPSQDLHISGAKNLASAEVTARTLDSEDIVTLKGIQVDSLNTPNLEVVRDSITVKKDFNAPLLKSVDELWVAGVDISGIKKDAMIKRLTVNSDTKTPKYLSKTKKIVFLGIPETLKEVKGNTSLVFDYQILEHTDRYRFINSNKIKFKLGPSVRIDGRILVESAEEFQKYKWVNATDVNFIGDIGESIEIPGTKKKRQDTLDLRETNVSKVKVGVSKNRYTYLPDTVISLDVAESNYDTFVFKGNRYWRQSGKFDELLKEIQKNYTERVGNIENINKKRSLKGLPPLDPKLISKSKRTPLEMYRKYKLGEIKGKDINMGDKLREMGNISSIVSSTDSYVDTILRERANLLSTVDADTFNQAFASTPPETIRGIVEYIRELRIREGEFSSSLQLKATHFDSSMLETIQSIGREALRNDLNTALLSNEFEAFLLHYYKTL